MSVEKPVDKLGIVVVDKVLINICILGNLEVIHIVINISR